MEVMLKYLILGWQVSNETKNKNCEWKRIEDLFLLFQRE